MKLRGPQGQVVDVDAGEAARLIQTVGGWTEVVGDVGPQTAVQQTAAEQPGAAFLAGLARVPTLGASDLGPLPFGIGPQLPEARAAVREENPKAALAGEAVGAFVAPTSRISGAANTVKGAVALGAVEGGLFGLGSAITEDALGDQQALGEQLAARVGGGALAGGAVSGLFQKVLGGAGRVALAEEAVTLPKQLDDFAAKAASTLRKDRITSDAALQKAGIEWGELNAWAKEQGLFNRATSPEALYTQTNVALSRAKAQSGDALLALNAKGAPDAVKLVAAVEPLLEDAAVLMTQPGLVAEAKRAMKGFAADAAIGPELGRVSPAVGDLPFGLVVGKKGGQARSAELVNIAFDALEGAGGEKQFDWLKLRDVTAGWSQKAKTAPLAEAVRVEALKQALKLDPAAADALENSFKAERFGTFLQEQLSSASAATELNLSSTIGTAAVAGAFGGPAAAFGTVASQVVGNQAQKRGALMAARALDELPTGSAMRAMAEGLMTNVKARLNTLPELLGPFRGVLENAAATGAADLLATHLELAKGPNGDEYLSTLGFQRGEAADAPALGKKAEAIATLMRLQMQVDTDIGQTIKGLDRSPEDVKAERDFRQTYDAVQKMLLNPAYDDKLGAVLPGTSMGLSAQLSKATQFVWSAAPKDPNQHLPPSIRPEWKPTAMEEERFMARAEAAFEPLKALESIMRGEPAQERLAALAALYPKLLEKATEKLFERLNSEKPLTGAQRQRLVPILGPEAVGLSAQQSALIASIHVQSAQGQQDTPRTDGRQVVNQSKNMDTQSQRIEARRGNT